MIRKGDMPMKYLVLFIAVFASASALSQQSPETNYPLMAIGDNAQVTGQCNIAIGKNVIIEGGHNRLKTLRGETVVSEITADIHRQILEEVDRATFDNPEQRQYAKTVLGEWPSSYEKLWNEYCSNR